MFTHSITVEPDIEPAPIREIGDIDIDDVSTVAHAVNVQDFDDSQSDNITPKKILPFRHKLLFILLFSTILHAAAFYLASLRVQMLAFKEDVAKPTILKAILYKRVPKLVTNQPETVEVINSKPKAVNKVKEPVVTEENSATIAIEESKKLRSEIVKAPLFNIQKPTQKSSPPPLEAPVTKPKSIFDSIASRDIRLLEQGKKSRLASQAFKEYQYNKTHPEIQTPSKKLLTADELMQKSIERKVDCKTTAGKVLNTISGLGHGTTMGEGSVKCHQYGDINSFIKKRLEKFNASPPSQ